MILLRGTEGDITVLLCEPSRGGEEMEMGGPEPTPEPPAAAVIKAPGPGFNDHPPDESREISTVGPEVRVGENPDEIGTGDVPNPPSDTTALEDVSKMGSLLLGPS